MNSSAYDPLALARDLGVKLGVDTDQEPLQILAKPRERITDKLREGIKANRDDLIRALLFRQAGEWIGGRPFEAPDDADKALNNAWLWKPEELEGFRRALRAWASLGLKAGLANAKANAKAKPGEAA